MHIHTHTEIGDLIKEIEELKSQQSHIHCKYCKKPILNEWFPAQLEVCEQCIVKKGLEKIYEETKQEKLKGKK